MVKIYFVLILCILGFENFAQTLISTNHTPTTTQTGGVTFNVQNTKANDVRIVSIASTHFTVNTATSATVTLWYKTTPVNTAPGAITVGNGWVNAGTATFTGTTNVISPFISGLTINIPAGSTYGFYLQSTQNLGVQTIPAATVNTFTGFGGVNLFTGDTNSFGGAVTGPTTINRGFVGNIGVIDIIACTGTPTAGAIDGVNGFCAGQNKLYLLNGNSSEIGNTIVWQSGSTSAGPFTTIAGATTNVVTKINTVSTYYRTIVTCANSGLKDTSDVFADTLKAFYLCYCASNAINTNDTKIEEVSFLSTNTISPSNATCEVYTDYRSLPVPNIKAGNSFNFRMRNGSCSGTHFPAFGVLFIDLNRDGIFQTTEKIGATWGLSSALYTDFITTATIPFTNPRGITGLRVLWYQSPAPTTACHIGAFGETEDYLLNIFLDPEDMAIKSLDTMVSDCSLSTTFPITFKAANEGLNSLVNPSFSYSINGGTPVTETFTNSVPSGTSAFFTFTTTADLNTVGSYVVKIWSNNSSDTAKSNDTLSKIIESYPIPTDPIAINDTVCVGALSSTIGINSLQPGMTYRWFDVANNQVGTGNTFTKLNPTSSLTYNVQAAFPLTTSAGLPNIINEGQSANINAGLIFNVLTPKMMIKSVKMKFASTGIAIIEFRNSVNVLITTVGYVVDTVGEHIVPINVELNAGTGYKILLSTNPGLTANSTSFNSYPVTLPGVVSITSSSLANQYLFFYDWKVTYDKCFSNKVPVNIEYISTSIHPIKPFTKDRDTFCKYPGKTLFALNLGCTYLWQDNMNTSGKFVPDTSGLYIVTIKNKASCKVKDSIYITIKSSPVIDLGKDSTICSNSSIVLTSPYSNVGYNHTWNYIDTLSPREISPKLWRDSMVDSGLYFDVSVDSLYFHTVKINTKNDSSFDQIGTFIINKPLVKDTLFLYNFLIRQGIDTITIPLDISIPRGIKYKMILKNYMGNVAVIPDYTTSYPQSIPGVVSITGPIALTSPLRYEMFYDWQIAYKPLFRPLNNNLKITSPGTYYLSVFNTNTQCGITDKIVIKTQEAPFVFLGNDTFICNNGNLTLRAPLNSNFTYKWFDGATSNSKNILASNPSITLEVTDNSTISKCKNSDTISVIISNLKKPNLGLDVQTCNSSKTIGDTFSSKYNYKWNTGALTNNLTVTDSGLYILTITENGTICSSSDSIKVRFLKSIPLNLGPDITTCKTVHILNAPQGFSTYNWSNGFTTNFTNITSSQTVTLTVTDLCGTKTDQVKISFETPASVVLPEDTIICKDYTVSIPAQPSTNQISWSDGSQGTNFTIRNTGMYWVRVKNSCGTFSDAISVVRDSAPTADFYTKANGSYVSFNNISTNGYSYLWSFGDDSTSTQKNPSHLYKNKGTYTVKLKVTNTCGEISEKTITIVLYGSAIQVLDVSNINIYPNPVAEVLSLDATSLDNGRYEISLSSMDGKVVSTEYVNVISNQLFKSINVNSFSNGLYILTLRKNSELILLKNINIVK